MTDAHTTRETADHAELARLAEAATQGQWWTEKTKSYYSVKANRPRDYGGNHKPAGIAYITKPTKYSIPNLEFIAAANPATVLSLLSEIAALRGERDRLKLAICGGEDVPGAIDAVTVDECEGFIREERQRHDGLLTQAERQRDELRKALEFYANPEIYKPHPHGLAFDDRDVSFRAKSVLANHGADQNKIDQMENRS